MSYIRLYPVQKTILYCAIVLTMLCTISPFVDYYVNWYITVIPLAIIVVYLQSIPLVFKSLMYILFLGLCLCLYQLWFINHRADFLTYIINGIITWAPCVLALACKYLLNLKVQKRLLQIALIAMMITSYTTVIGLESFPFASRELAGAADSIIREKYMRMNIGGFEFIYALIVCLPIVVWMINNTRRYLKILNYVILFSFFNCIFKSAYTTALIISLLVVMLIIINKCPNSRPLLYIVFFLFFVLIFTGIMSEIVLWLSKYVESDYVADRLHQVAFLLQGTPVNDIDTETTNERLVLMQNAWNGFLHSPIWGNNVFVWHKEILSGHSFLLDILSSSGILGMIFYVKVFHSIYKKIFPIAFKSQPYQSRLVWIAFISITIMNPANFALIYLAVFTFTTIINNIEKSI